MVIPGSMQDLGVDEHGITCFKTELVRSDQTDDSAGKEVKQLKLIMPVPCDPMNGDIVVIGCGREGLGGMNAFFFSVGIDGYVISKKGQGGSFHARQGLLSPCHGSKAVMICGTADANP